MLWSAIAEPVRGEGAADNSKGVPAGRWRDVSRITAGNGEERDNFGDAVAIRGDTLVVGAPYVDGASPSPLDVAGDHNDVGAAYVFESVAGEWVQKEELRASDPWTDAWFGASVDLDGDTLMIGAPGDRDFSGAVYVFERTEEGWTESQKLVLGLHQSSFGTSVDIDGDTAAIGASELGLSGAAFVYTRGTDGSWTREAWLDPGGLTKDAYFGHSIAATTDVVVVGAIYQGRSGAAYAFRRDGSGSWALDSPLVPAGVEEDAGVGVAVAVDGGTAVVGAFLDQDGLGTAYVFASSADEPWTEVATLATPAQSDAWGFGSAVAVEGDTVVVGAPSSRAPSLSPGAAYVFSLLGMERWHMVAEVADPAGAYGDLFGLDVAIDRSRIAVGAPWVDVDEDKEGAAFIAS